MYVFIMSVQPKHCMPVSVKLIGKQACWSGAKSTLSNRRRLILKCQIASSQIKVIFSCDYALFPPVSSRGKKQSKKHTNWWRGLV